MPIFEYHCDACDKDFEQLVFGSDPKVECPVCGKTEVHKLMSTCAAKVGFKFTATSSKSSCSGCSSTSCSSCG